jgi:deoxyribodipyrimidine photolyase-related protein
MVAPQRYLKVSTMQTSKTLRLILGDQLNSRHSWYSRPQRHVVFAMMEVRQETDYVKHHIQKIVGFFAAMRGFADWLRSRGHRVVYLALDDDDNRQNLEENIIFLLGDQQCECFEYQSPDEYRLDQQLSAIAARLPVPHQSVDTEHFLTGREEVKKFFRGKKQYLMEPFYRHLRKKYQILLSNGKPVGGKWNYDQHNRQSYDGAVPIPAPMVFDNRVEAIAAMLEDTGVKSFGRIDPNRFIWPINREQALQQLDEFIDARLAHFGTYQDAMSGDHWSLFHSRLSFALNTKMLHPMEVIEAALKQSSGRRSSVGIAALEGFIRQILGWREYVRGVYWAHMPAYADMNFFGHTAELPDFYWTAATHMNCLKIAVKQSLAHAYAHHIHRLMVTGNFAMIAGIAPDQVDDWYLGVYIDAVQWVEIVNTRGMSQYADGGIVATKPYAASANYIQKMSDYCNRCHYNYKQKIGERACPFNSLYWDFLVRSRSKLKKNFRMGMMYRVWDRMPADRQQSLLEHADSLKADLNAL